MPKGKKVRYQVHTKDKNNEILGLDSPGVGHYETSADRLNNLS